MIEASELTKRYEDVTAVGATTFSARPGVVTGFLGPNGAGKTTTVQVILVLDRPTSGPATINGWPLRDAAGPLSGTQTRLTVSRGARLHSRAAAGSDPGRRG